VNLQHSQRQEESCQAVGSVDYLYTRISLYVHSNGLKIGWRRSSRTSELWIDAKSSLLRGWRTLVKKVHGRKQILREL
jgi:hypothetical protein